MILAHLKKNQLGLKRTDQQKLVNLFWKDFVYNQGRDINDVYDFEVLDGCGNDDFYFIVYTAPVTRHKDEKFKKYSYLLILYNQGTVVIGDCLKHIVLNKKTALLKWDKIERQQELDVLLLDKHEYHEVAVDRRMLFLKRDPNFPPLCIALSLESDVVFEDFEDLKINFKKNIENLLRRLDS